MDHPPLHVAVVLPPAPYALATSGFLSTLAQVEAEIAALKVTDGPSAQACANIQTRLTSAGSALEKQRKALKEPFIEAGRAIDRAAAAPGERIEAAKQQVKRLLTAYDNEQRRLQAEAERARLAEIARLQKIADDEAAAAKAEADRIAAELAAKAGVTPVAEEWDEEVPAPPVVKTETQKAIETLTHAPAVVAPRPAGVAFRTVLVATVTDVNKLPDCFVVKTANLAAIRATFCSKWSEGQALPVLDGVKFEMDRQPVATGKRSF